MGKHSKQQSSSNANEDVKREHPLQAVVFADSFTQTFRPITIEQPKVLLPLVNVPMLEYTLEFLASSGVQEIFVFCTSHSEEVERYIQNESTCAKTLSVRCITSSTCLSAGDALRELDRMQVIRSDPFILLNGDVVSNMNLKSAIESHKERKKKDPLSIMTTVFKKVHANHPARSLIEDLVIAMNVSNNQILMYDESDNKSSVVLPNLFLKEHVATQFRNDLLDCHIDICSLDVLVQFSDNFDYQDIRRDFIHNEVQNYELGNKIHAKIIDNEYAARVHDPRTYHTICQDILHRWTYPLVPDNNFLGNTSYKFSRRGIYKENNVTLSRSCVLKEDTVIGSGTVIQDNCSISKTVIGRNCRIGQNVTIENSFLWDNVVVEDGVSISGAILCKDTIIKQGARVPNGCIISFKCLVGENMEVPAFSKVTTVEPVKEDDGFSSEEEDEEEKDEPQWDVNVVGKCGIGRLWTVKDEGENPLLGMDDEDDDDSDEDEDGITATAKMNYEAFLKKTLFGSDEMEHQCLRDREEYETLYSSDEEPEDGSDFGMEEHEATFQDIVCDTIQSGDQAGQNLDDIFLEIKGVKFAQDRSFSDCLEAMVPALLGLVDLDLQQTSASTQDTIAFMKSIRNKFQKWQSVLKRCIIEPVDEMAVMTSMERYTIGKEETYFPFFRCMLQTVYDLELVSEDSILAWSSKCQDMPGDLLSRKLVEYHHVKEFIEWLEEDSEDEEDDSDESGDSDEE